MSTRSSFSLIGAAGLLLTLAHTAGAQGVHRLKPASTDVAIIQRTSSATKYGYTIVLQLSGVYRVEGEITKSGNTTIASLGARDRVDLRLTKRLFHDLKLDMPLSKLPVDHEANRGTFDTMTYVFFRDQRTPDLTFGGVGRANDLRNDVSLVTSDVGVDYNRPVMPKSVQALASKSDVGEIASLHNAGSTNTFGYEIDVNQRGEATISEPIDEKSGVIGWRISQIDTRPTLPADLTRKLFADLDAAMPLTSLSVRHGMRSASFGTSTSVTYKGQTSPDLTFGGDGPADALKADVEAITQYLHVRNAPRRPLLMRPITP